MTLTISNLKTLNPVKQKNSKEIVEQGLNILLRLLDNVINEPGNASYRRIRVENKTIKEKLLSVSGMDQLLIEIGFVNDKDFYSLPNDVLIARLKDYRVQIQNILNENEKESEPSGVVKKPKIIKPDRIIPRALKSFKSRTSFPQVIHFNNQFLHQLESLSDQVMQYEDDLLQEYGKKFIPIEKLKLKTIESLRRIQKTIVSGKCKDPEPSYDDLFVWELTEWFKNEFFTWVNSAKCPICNREDTQSVGQIVKDGVRVEQYRCCNRLINFYRFNDIVQLLQTRKGRCGEFANCFTFLCRCLGLRARYVYSTEDHVWTEIFSTAQNRWIHVDPSDNVIDAPLMYEHGWKKEIRYVIAFAHDDVQDVTWRYTNQHKKVLQKRNLCGEKELLETILALRRKRQEGFSEYKIKNFKKRTLRELSDLMIEREPSEDEKRGRSSGSLAWRQARLEVSNDSFNVFEPLDDEIQSKQFNLRYSTALDTYERFLCHKDNPNNVIKTLSTQQGWQNYVYHADKMFKKYEPDWKMIYLARQEGAESSSIIWRFDFSAKNLKIDNLQYKFETKTYENGHIDVFLMDKNGLRIEDIKCLKGESKFSIKAVLSGGKGDCAWQHTQLFRQEKGSKDFPFILNIKFL